MHTSFLHLAALRVLALCACLFMGIPAGPASAQATQTLAGELRTALAQGGAAAARQRFAEIWPAQKSRYPYEPGAFMQLIQEQLETGSMDTLKVLAEINAQLMQESLNAAVPAGPGAEPGAQVRTGPGTDQTHARQGDRDAAAERETQERVAAQERGTMRDDLGRFIGMYGEAGRQMFVNTTCDGRLAAAPTWADIAPWRMRSAADAVFSYSDSFLSFAMEFELDANGRALALRHDIDGMPSPMLRSGDLPPNLRDCLPAPVR